MIVEWNTHIFSSDETKYSFHPWAAYKPKPAMRFEDPLGDYLELKDNNTFEMSEGGSEVSGSWERSNDQVILKLN